MAPDQPAAAVPLRALTVAVAAVACLVGPGAGRAEAHAVPLTMDPRPNAVLAVAPGEVSIRFSERVEPRVSSLRVLDARGQAVQRDPAMVDPADPWRFRVPLGQLGDGTYTVAWRVLSADDGHLTEGAHAFAVGAASPGAAPIVAATRSTGAVAGRLLLTAGALLLVAPGLIAPLAGIQPSGGWRGLLQAGAALVLAGSALSALALRAGLGAGVPWTVILATTPGKVEMGRMALGAIALGLGLRVRRGAPGMVDAGLAAGAGVAGTMVLGLGTLLGHAAAAAPAGGMPRIAQIGHVLAVSAWIGGLALLAWTGRSFAPASGAPGSGSPGPWVALARFSIVATVGGGVTLGTGLVLADVHISGPLELVSTAYGRILLAKLAAVALVLILALGHRSALAGAARGRAVAWPARGLRLEAGAAALTLLLAAVLAGTPPPPVAAPPGAPPAVPSAPALSVSGNVEDAVITVGVSSLRPGPTTLRATVLTPDGAPLPGARAALLRLEAHGSDIGPVALTLAPEGPGVFVARDVLIGVAAYWSGRLVVQRDEAFDLHLAFDFQIEAGPPPGAAAAPAPAAPGRVFRLARPVGAAVVLTAVLTVVLALTAGRTLRALRTVRPHQPPAPQAGPEVTR